MKFKLLALAIAAIFVVGCDDEDSNRHSSVTTTSTPDAQGATTTTTTDYLNTAGGQSFTTTQAGQFFATPGHFTDGLPPNTYLQLLFKSPYDPRVQLYLPKYSYYQGLVYAARNLQVIGQVRVVGAAMNAGSNSKMLVAQGAMVTTDPDYLKDQLQPPNQRYTILQWKEIP